MKKYVWFISLSVVLMLEGCSSLFVSEPKYVHVSGTQFEYNGKPYYFVGTNLWYGCYLGSPGTTGNRERLVRELDKMKSLGITNLRICAAS